MTNNKSIITRWTTDKNIKLLTRYQELNLIPFSCSLNEISRTNDDGEMKTKKELSNLPQHANITKYNQQFIKTYNGLCLKMGTKIDDEHHVILLDIDNKNDTVDRWLNIVKIKNKTVKFQTPTAITGNNGIHYLFKVSSEQFDKMQKNIHRINN